MSNYQNNIKKTPADNQVIEIAREICAEIFTTEAVNPLFLKNRTLTISCANQVIAQEVQAKQGVIIDKINLKLGKKEIDRIRYLL